jgi:hypothetical protein
MPPRFHSTAEFARFTRRCWREARKDYEASGTPFGRSNRAFELWIMYGTRTTRGSQAPRLSERWCCIRFI